MATDKKTLDFLVVHPEKHHILPLVVGLERSGRSYNFLTPLYRKGLGALLSKVPGALGTKAGGYSNEEIDSGNVCSPLFCQTRKLISHLRPNRTAFYHWFDLYVTGLILGRHIEAKWLVTLQDYMPLAMAAARSVGMKTWSDQISNQSQSAIERLLRHHAEYGVDIGVRELNRVNEEIVSQSDLITVPSRYCLDGIGATASSMPQIKVLPYGVAAGSTRPISSRASKVRIVARANTIRKGGHLFIEAMRLNSRTLLNHAEDGIDIVFLGEVEPVLQAAVAKLREIDGLTVQSGNIPHKNVWALYESASCFVMPALSEGMSLAALEAMTAGLPLIITPYCGVDCFESPKMGYLVSDTTASVGAGLCELFAHRSMWRSMGDAARKAAAFQSWDTYSNGITKIAKELTE